MRKFTLNRKKDVAGVSGTGRVAQGVLFDNGKVALTWLTSIPSVTVHDSIENMEKVHCHNGETVIEWSSPLSASIPNEKYAQQHILKSLTNIQHELDRLERPALATELFAIRNLLDKMW